MWQRWVEMAINNQVIQMPALQKHPASGTEILK